SGRCAWIMPSRSPSSLTTSPSACNLPPAPGKRRTGLCPTAAHSLAAFELAQNLVAKCLFVVAGEGLPIPAADFNDGVGEHEIGIAILRQFLLQERQRSLSQID